MATHQQLLLLLELAVGDKHYAHQKEFHGDLKDLRQLGLAKRHTSGETYLTDEGEGLVADFLQKLEEYEEENS